PNVGFPQVASVFLPRLNLIVECLNHGLRKPQRRFCSLCRIPPRLIAQDLIHLCDHRVRQSVVGGPQSSTHLETSPAPSIVAKGMPEADCPPWPVRTRLVRKVLIFCHVRCPPLYQRSVRQTAGQCQALLVQRATTI